VVRAPAGEPAAAEEQLRSAYERSTRWVKGAVRVDRCDARAGGLRTGPVRGGGQFCARRARRRRRDDFAAQVEWRGIAAKLLAQRGRTRRRRRSRGRPSSSWRGPTSSAITGRAPRPRRGLALGGKPQQASAAFRAALELYEQKGDTVMAARARSRLDATGPA
jgi:hypothetical protein